MHGEVQQPANADALVTADWLAVHLHDESVRIVEIDVSPRSYAHGHIPGAVLWDIYKELKDAEYRLLDAAAFETIVRASGIDARTHVVVYGYGAALGYWLLKLYRQPRVSILNASKERWHADGRPWTLDVVPPKPTTYDLPPENSDIRARQHAVVATLGDRSVVLADVRSREEFSGERFWPSGAPAGAGRAGHVPGAIHVPPDGFLTTDGAFASLDTLRALFPPAFGDGREIITYCTIGNRASLAWFVLSELFGRSGVRVYDGSWAEWGLTPGTPIET